MGYHNENWCYRLVNGAGATWRKVIIVFLMTMIVVGSGEVTHAHNIWIFAYESGSEIVVEGRFGNGRPVLGGDVRVFYPKQNTPFATGKTNTQGVFRLQRPDDIQDGSNLRIVLDAGNGHLAQWQLTVQSPTQLVRAVEHGEKEKSFPAVSEKVKREVPTICEEKQLEELITRVVAREVEPVKRILLENSHKGPTLSEIIGGIGWLVGLAGLISYMKNKKTSK